MAHGKAVANEGVIQAELLLGVAIDAFGAGALAVDGLIERSRVTRICASASQFSSLIQPLPLRNCSWSQLCHWAVGTAGAAKALGAIAGGVSELVDRIHAQPSRTQRHAIGGTLSGRVPMLVLGDSSDAVPMGARLIDATSHQKRQQL